MSLLSITESINRLDERDIEKYFFDAEHMKSASNGEFEQVIVFGTSGKPVRARTVNQLHLLMITKTMILLLQKDRQAPEKHILQLHWL